MLWFILLSSIYSWTGKKWYDVMDGNIILNINTIMMQIFSNGDHHMYLKACHFLYYNLSANIYIHIDMCAISDSVNQRYVWNFTFLDVATYIFV